MFLIVLTLFGFNNFQIKAQVPNLSEADLFGKTGVPINSSVKPFEDLFFLVRQDYVLRTSDGNEYGIDGKDYFGREYGIAIMGLREEGPVLWADKSLAEPWVKDNKVVDYFDKKPYPKATFIRPVIRKQDGFKVKYTTTNFGNDLVVFKLPSGYSGIPNLAESDSLPKNGKLILVITKDNVIQDSTKFQLMSMDISPKWDSNQSVGAIKTINISGKRIIGGGFFQEKVSIGMIAYNLVGLCIDSGNGWVIKVIPNKKPDVIEISEK